MSNYGKRRNFWGNTVEPQGSGCTGLCAILCETGAVTLCKCKNGKASNKGSTYHENRNYQIAIHREPTYS